MDIMVNLVSRSGHYHLIVAFLQDIFPDRDLFAHLVLLFNKIPRKGNI